jgi:hypothetical protein
LRRASFSPSVSARTVPPDTSRRGALSPLALRAWPCTEKRFFFGLAALVELASLPSPGVSGKRPDEPVVDPLGEYSRMAGRANGLVGGRLGSICFVLEGEVGARGARGDSEGTADVDTDGEMRGADPAFEFAGGIAEVDTDGEIFGARPRRDELGGGGISEGDVTIFAVGSCVSATLVFGSGSSAAFAAGAGAGG